MHAMHAAVVRSCAAALLAWRVAGVAQAQPAPAVPDVAAIDGYVQTAMRRDRVPGAAVAVVHEGRIVYMRGYGTDGHGRPVTPQTSFVLGSMSKAFTALAVMQLVEDGVVALDAPVQRYLPWFRVADPSASAAITVRHLLQHTSGIPERAPRARGAARTLADHARALADVSPRHAPGTRHEYASPNYQVLGAIVEQVTGRPYAEHVQRRIFTPLAMAHSFTDEQRATRDGMARGHRYWFGFPVAATLEHEADRLPTAALIGSAEDLAHFLIAQSNGGRYDARAVLSPAGMARMHTPGADHPYAFGWRVGTIGGVPAVHHGGIVPHFRGKMVLLPAQRWGVVVLTNASTTSPLPIVPTSHRMADAIAASLVGRPLPDADGRHRTLTLALTIALALMLASQLLGLVRIDRWRARRAGWTRARILGAVGVELLWPVVALVGLPVALGLPWAELLRGTPDLAGWLLVSAALGVLTAAAKARAGRAVSVPA